MKKKPVKILPKHSVGVSDWYDDWFTCPVCKTRGTLTKTFKFCPACGVKLDTSAINK